MRFTHTSQVVAPAEVQAEEQDIAVSHLFAGGHVPNWQTPPGLVTVPHVYAPKPCSSMMETIANGMSILISSVVFVAHIIYSVVLLLFTQSQNLIILNAAS
jgi:hypothetical protein